MLKDIKYFNGINLIEPKYMYNCVKLHPSEQNLVNLIENNAAAYRCYMKTILNPLDTSQLRHSKWSKSFESFRSEATAFETIRPIFRIVFVPNKRKMTIFIQRIYVNTFFG